jgi:hypothetical protein
MQASAEYQSAKRLVRSEQEARAITGDTTMMNSKEKLSAKAPTKLGLATTAAVLWIATLTLGSAAVTSIQSTGAASALASHVLEAQVQTLRECDPDISDYVDDFEGMLSELTCRS